MFIVAKGKVAVVENATPDGRVSEHVIAELHEGHAFGEMALLSGGPRTATIRAVGETELLAIDKDDFERLVAADHKLASAVQHLSHARAISNLSAGGTNPATWAKVASNSLDHVSRSEANKMLHEAGHGAGTAIIFSNLLNSVPGCFVIGAKFHGMASLSASVMLGMFLGGLSEAAVSATMLTKAGYRPRAIYGMWSTVLLAGVIAAVAGRLLIGNQKIPGRRLRRGARRRCGARGSCPRNDPGSDPRRRLVCGAADCRRVLDCLLSRAHRSVALTAFF